MKTNTSSVITHIAGWILFLTLPLLFVAGQQEQRDVVSIIASPTTWLFFITYIAIFYLNALVLLPFLYTARRYLLYFLAIALLLVAVIKLRPFDRMLSELPDRMQMDGPPPPGAGFDRPPMRPMDPPPPPADRPGSNEPGRLQGRPKVDVVSIFLFIMILALSMAMEIRQRLRLSHQRLLKAEADKANAELAFLKAQIHPHFLFNTLNNIYSLAVTNNANTAISILKLSNIMRYVTDEIDEDYVSLENEVDCVSDYIDLQRLRLGKTTIVNFSKTGDLQGRKIAPLVLMSFVENIFKYGISNHEQSEINIALNVESDRIIFFCRNKLFESRPGTERTGIGIKNTRQRLEHLYPGKFRLDIEKENGYFTVLLVIHT